jgi:hypothetical protein
MDTPAAHPFDTFRLSETPFRRCARRYRTGPHGGPVRFRPGTDGNLHEPGRNATAAAVLAGIVMLDDGRTMFGNLARIGGLRKEFVGMAKFYIHRALMRCGRTAEALDDIRAYFGRMLELEATTCWELCDKPRRTVA